MTSNIQHLLWYVKVCDYASLGNEWEVSCDDPLPLVCGVKALEYRECQAQGFGKLLWGYLNSAEDVLCDCLGLISYQFFKYLRSGRINRCANGGRNFGIFFSRLIESIIGTGALACAFG